MCGVATAGTPPTATRGVVIRGVGPQSHPLVSYDRTDDVLYCTGTFADSLWVGRSKIYSSGMNDVFLAAFDADLELLWLQRMGGVADDSVTCMTAVPSGGVALGLMCGGQLLDVPAYTIGTTTFTGYGGYDAVVTSVKRDGSIRWTRADGAESAEFPTALTAHNDDVYVCGTFVGKSRFGTTVVMDDGRTSAYMQRVSSTGESAWVVWTRGVRGSGQGRGRAEGGTACTVIDDRVRAVAQISSANRWGDNSIESTSFSYETKAAILTADTNGVEIDAALLSPCRGDSCPSSIDGRAVVSLVSESLNCNIGNEVGIGFHRRDRFGTDVDLRFPVGGARTVASATINGFGERTLGTGKYERAFSFTSTQVRPDIFTENFTLQDGYLISVHPDGTGDWATSFGASNWSVITSCALRGSKIAVVAPMIGQVRVGSKTFGTSITDTLGVIAIYEPTVSDVRHDAHLDDLERMVDVSLPVIDVMGKHVATYQNATISPASLPAGLYGVLRPDGALRRLLLDENGTVRIAE